MSSASAQEPASAIGGALLDFSLNDLFPEEDASLLSLSSDKLPGAIRALAQTKTKLEADIHTINQETAEDVGTWFDNAKSVQDDTNRSKLLANDILKQAEAPDVSGKSVQEAEAKAEFLIKELSYNQQVRLILLGIRGASQVLDQVEQASKERRILDALHLLEKSWAQLDAIPVSKSCRSMKLLDIRAFELKSDVHRVFEHVWNSLVHVDVEKHNICILDTRKGEPMSLADAVIGLKAYKEVDDRMAQLWLDLDMAIVGPRTDIESKSLPGISVNDSTLEIRGEADRSVDSLFADLEQIFTFLAKKLPADLVQSMSYIMIPDVTRKVITVWLDSAVPASLEEMDAFEAVIAAAKRFCAALAALNYSGFGQLQEWLGSAPKVWLAKCRETALDTVRTKLSQGLGSPKLVERIEKQMVSRSEGKHLAENGPSATADHQDWDAAWSSDEEQPRPAPAPPAEVEDDGTDAWGAWGDDGEVSEAKPAERETPEVQGGDEEEPSETWGWGDDDAQEEAKLESAAAGSQPMTAESPTREMILKETYNISSMPEPVLALIFAMLEDGAALTSEAHQSSPVAAAAAGLFSLPTLALAMFRAVAPYYYALDVGGNMFLYNDTSYLAERLVEFAAAWNTRDDLSARAKSMLRLDAEVKALQNFASRSYSSEMNTQKTVLRDLLGGLQNLLQQDDAESFIDAAVTRIKAIAVAWENILTRSAWYQAVGSLVNTVATKVISDVMELPSIGHNEAFEIAKLIENITSLDDLFLPSRAQGRAASEPNEAPATSQYAPAWFKLQYLSQVLQSNLNDMSYLWMEGELSLYFTPEEVVDLINLSFETSPRSREVIKEIMKHPQPRAADANEAW